MFTNLNKILIISAGILVLVLTSLVVYNRFFKSIVQKETAQNGNDLSNPDAFPTDVPVQLGKAPEDLPSVPADQVPERSQGPDVLMSDTRYIFGHVFAYAGETMVWFNDTGSVVNVTSDFDNSSRQIKPNEEFPITFPQPGEYQVKIAGDITITHKVSVAPLKKVISQTGESPDQPRPQRGN